MIFHSDRSHLPDLKKGLALRLTVACIFMLRPMVRLPSSLPLAVLITLKSEISSYSWPHDFVTVASKFNATASEYSPKT